MVSSIPQTKKKIYDLNLAEYYFEEFIQEYNKVYESETEKQKRFEIFKQKLTYINQVNSDETELAEFGTLI
jgi:hypothetical protein